MTTTEAKWAARVRQWRASGKTAEGFSSGMGFEGATLRYWSSRLNAQPGSAMASSAAIVRVIRRPGGAPASGRNEGASPESAIEVVVGSARIVVRIGFNVQLLRELVAALGAGR